MTGNVMKQKSPAAGTSYIFIRAGLFFGQRVFYQYFQQQIIITPVSGACHFACQKGLFSAVRGS